MDYELEWERQKWTKLSIELEDFLDELHKKALEAKAQAEKKRSQFDEICADNTLEILTMLRPFAVRVMVTDSQSIVVEKMIAKAASCTYSYMRHCQIGNLINMLIALGR